MINDGAAAAEMVRVTDRVGVGLIFEDSNPTAAPDNSDFYEDTAAGSTNVNFLWDDVNREITWEIANLEPVEANAKTYRLFTYLDSGDCGDPVDRRNRIDATWMCAAGAVDEDPSTDEGICTSLAQGRRTGCRYCAETWMSALKSIRRISATVSSIRW